MAPLPLQAIRIVLAASMLVMMVISSAEELTEPQSPSSTTAAAASAPLHHHPSESPRSTDTKTTAAASAPLHHHPSESPRNTDTKTTAAASAPLHPSESPRNPDTKTTAAASAPLHPSESNYTYTMQFQIGDKSKTVVSGLVDTGSDLIWTNNSKLLRYSLKSCPSDDDGKEMTPSHGLCPFDKTYGYGAAHVRGRLGEAELTVGAYTTPDLIKIGSADNLRTSCGRPSFRDKNKMVCRAFRAGGIVGLGRGKLSLVSQLRLQNFSYCLPHSSAPQATGQINFNDTPTQDVPFEGTTTLETIEGLKDPASTRYYVGLKSINVGTANVDVPNGCFGDKPKPDPSSGDKPDHNSGDDKPDHSSGGDKPDYSSGDKLEVDGDRGMVIDSGTTFTTLPQKVFDGVKAEVKNLLDKKAGKELKEVLPAEDELEKKEDGLICYQGTRHEGMDSIVLHFCRKGQMEIPADNYFIDFKDEAKFCLAFKKQQGGGRMSILGAYQQRGMYMLFDIARNELSFTKRTACG